MQLYVLTSEFERLMRSVDESEDGELSEEFTCCLDMLSAAIDDKLAGIRAVLIQLGLEKDAIESEEKRLRHMRESRQKAIARLKDYAMMCLASINLKSVKVGVGKIWIQKNSRPSIKWLGEEKDIPEPFLRVTYSLDGDAAQESLVKFGELPENFEVKHGSHLRVT